MSGSVPTVTLDLTVLPTARATGAVQGQGVRLRVLARDGATNLPLAVTGLRVLARAPRSSVPVAYAQNQLTQVRPGEWVLDLVLEVSARWRFRAECTAPRAAAVEAQFTVAASAVLQPNPPDVLMVTPEGEVLETADGAAITARRLDLLPDLGAPLPDDRLPNTRNGAPGRITWGSLRDAAAENAMAAPFVRNTAVILPSGTLGGQIRERCSISQFRGNGATEAQALNAAIAEVANNNGAEGGEVVIPAGAAPLVLTAPVECRPNVRVIGQRRRVYVPSWGAGLSFGVFHLSGVNNFAVDGLTIEMAARNCSPIRVEGGSTGLRASNIDLINARTIWFENGGEAILSNITARGGTGLLGGGGSGSSSVYDVQLLGSRAYDMTSEAIDLNFNVRGMIIDDFIFARCCRTTGGETIDIGGGTHEDVILSNGMIDCGGTSSPQLTKGITAKQGVRRLTIDNVHIRNGNPGNSNCFAIHVTNAIGVEMRAFIDDTFARGLFIETSPRDVHFRGGRIDSPVMVSGAQRGSLTFDHDGGGTTSTAAAVTMGFGTTSFRYSGRVRGRPNATAIDIGGGSGEGGSGTVDCGVVGAVVEGCLRGINLSTIARRTLLRDLEMFQIRRNSIIVPAGLKGTRIQDVKAVDCSVETPRTFATIAVGAGCDGTIIRGVQAMDTTVGAARTSGAPVAFSGASAGVMVSEVLGDNLGVASAVTGLAGLANSFVGADIGMVVLPPEDTTLVAASYIDPAIVFARADTGFRERTDGIFEAVAAGLPRFHGPAQGLLVEGLRTPLLAARRDLTDAAWAKTNCTAARTATGIDGVANSATTLTATAANATVIQSLVLASALRTGVARVRRRTGTGVVQLTMDSGATWPVTLPLTAGWLRFPISQTLANPGFGIRIVTAGDQVDVDYADVQAGAFASVTPVPEGQASRPADAVRWDFPAGWPAARCVLVKGSVGDVFTNQAIMGTDAAGSSANRMRMQVAGTTLQLVVTVDSVNTTLNLGTLAPGAFAAAVAWDATGVSAQLLGNAVQTTASVPNAAQSRLFIGDATSNYTQSLNGVIEAARALVSRPADGALGGLLAAL